MGRSITFLYGIAAYVIFLATFVYSIGFVGNILVPKSIDSGAEGPFAPSIAINITLLSIFALQHSIMARPGFKRAWTKIIPKAAERSTYILMTCVAMVLIFVFWQPLPTPVWDISGTVPGTALWALFWAGWLVVLASTFMIDHLDLFGLRQIYANLRTRTATQPGFLKVGLYRLVRHPIMTGFLIAFWAAPVMSVGHLVFAAVTTGCISRKRTWSPRWARSTWPIGAMCRPSCRASGGGGNMALDPEHMNRIHAFTKAGPIGVLERQAPLRARYRNAPDAAWVQDHARTVDADVPARHPLHAHVTCGEGIPVDIPVSVHKAVGGESDFPCPGEILAAALASCLDTAIRMIANLKGIELAHLQVQVSLGADVRGTLMTGDDVPVGFQTAQMRVDLTTACGMSQPHLNALIDAAERSCVILQTLRAPPSVRIERCLGDVADPVAR